MARRGENIYKRADGRYEGRYIRSYTPEGKAVYGYVYDRSYAAARQKLHESRSQHTPPVPAGAGQQLAAWALCWLEQKTMLRPSTRSIYAGYLRHHIIPALGHIPLSCLKSADIRSFLQQEGALLAPKTVQLLFSFLRSILRAAQQEYALPDIISGIRLSGTRCGGVRVLRVQEQKALERAAEAALEQTPNALGILLCLYTGLRIGELCALQWRDIDAAAGTIHVTHTLTRLDGALQLTGPKSACAVREIPVPQFLLDRLSRQVHTGPFVIHNNGAPLDPRVYRRFFKSILQRAGIADIKFHALRHTFATRALEVGFDAKSLSEILGHASVTITLNLYAHSLIEHKKKQMERLGLLYVSPSESAVSAH